MLTLLRRVAAWLGALPRPLAWLLAAGWAALIWWFSSQPGDVLPAAWYWDYAANLAHAPLFGLLALWVASAVASRPVGEGWPAPGLRGAVLTALVVLAWGVTDELHQSMVADRTPSMWDLGTDVGAALLVLWIATYVGRGAGGRGATEGGLLGRLAAGIAACLGWAALVTFGVS
jgi:hypothetical protein